MVEFHNYSHNHSESRRVGLHSTPKIIGKNDKLQPNSSFTGKRRIDESIQKNLVYYPPPTQTTNYKSTTQLTGKRRIHPEESPILTTKLPSYLCILLHLLTDKPSQLLRLMGRYAGLHDNRVHIDRVEKNSPEGLRNRASFDRAVQAGGAKAEETEEAKYRHVGGGSGRLGAAVQRAMAMRERQSTEGSCLKGIGAMRQLCNISCLPPHNIHNTLSAQPPAEYWSTAEEASKQVLNIVSPAPGIRSQSMRYSRIFCSAPIADDDQYSSSLNINKPPDLGNNSSCRSLPQSHQRSENAPAKKKGFLRKLFRFH